MGVSITAKNSNYSFDMGYGSFFTLRKNIALAYNKTFGENYAALLYCHTEEAFKKNDDLAERIIKTQGLTDSDIIDFLYQSDCEGKISYKTCKKIYDLIKDIDYSGCRIVYASLSEGNDYEQFKAFLKECYRYHRNMYWR